VRLRNIEYKYLVAAAFVFGLFMDIMDSTVVNVALPTLEKQFHAGTDTVEWVVTGYLLSLAVWVPASGWIGDRFGTKRTFCLAMAMFIAGSALCGLSQSIGQLIAFRFLQGIGGGMMTPVGTAMLYRAFPVHERAKASAYLAVPTMIAPMVGPVLGGWLVTNADWRWVFYINLPVGLLGFLIALRFLREHREATAGRFDPWGFALSGLGLALVLYALSQAPSFGWTSPRVLGSGLTGLACFGLMVMIELAVPEPMLALRLFADRMFRSSLLVFFLSTCGMIGVVFLLPLFLQQLRGLSAFQSGLATFPQAVAMILMLQVTSRLYGDVGPRRMIGAGMLIVTLSAAAFMLVGLGTDIWWVRSIMFLRGTGMAFVMVSSQAATFSTIKAQDTGRASSLFNTNRQVASSFGVAVLATVLVSRIAASMPAGVTSPITPGALHAQLLAFHDAYFVAVLFGLAGFACTFLIHDEDAAASMSRRRVEVVEAIAAD
jgi:EmrB/QacA subfamily drug resistance transporter